MWDIPTMTVTIDSKRRAILPAKPGLRFDVQIFGDEKIILTKLIPAAPRPAKVTFRKVDGFTVAKTNQPINESALKEALAEFP
jgi:hypothetical protein